MRTNERLLLQFTIARYPIQQYCFPYGHIIASEYNHETPVVFWNEPYTHQNNYKMQAKPEPKFLKLLYSFRDPVSARKYLRTVALCTSDVPYVPRPLLRILLTLAFANEAINMSASRQCISLESTPLKIYFGGPRRRVGFEWRCGFASFYRFYSVI